MLFLTCDAGPAVISQTDGCYWMEGIALSNWTFRNNVIKGVNQGVAGEAADIFIGNSVPVRPRSLFPPPISCHPPSKELFF
jgi:hypothetical protein